MRLAKTLLKMTDKNEIRAQLPDWFDGEVYEIGDEVRNPFSGETIMLDAAELSMYEVIKGAEMILLMTHSSERRLVELIRKGQDWMLAKNPQAYMTLID